MSRRWPLLLGLIAATTMTLVAQQGAGPPTPRFRTDVEALPVDVTILDGQGRPVTDLTAADFTVTLNGMPRRVLSAQWISAGASTARIAAATPDGYTSNEQADGGRLIALVVDQPNLRLGAGRPLIDTMTRFVDQLPATDRIAVIGLGNGPPAVPFTTDRGRVRQALARMNGQRPASTQTWLYNLNLSTALAIRRGDVALKNWLLRNCPLASGADVDISAPGGSSPVAACEQEIDRQIEDLVQNAERTRIETLRSLTGVLNGLASIDAPKSLLLITEGITMPVGDDGTWSSLLATVGNLAAAARTSIYALRFESDQAFDPYQRVLDRGLPDDRELRVNGLDRIVSVARGSVFAVTNAGDAAFERIGLELAGSYLLGLETTPDDQVTTSRTVHVEVSRRGLTVRAPTSILTSRLDNIIPRSPQAAAAGALASPLPLLAIPLRVATFSFGGSSPSQVQLLIEADIGRGYDSPQNMAVAYIIADGDGRLVESGVTTARLATSVPGMASPLRFRGSAAVPPGDYTLKLAASDGVQVGSVEHIVHAALADAGTLKLSDLTVGGPVPTGADPVRPSVDYTVRFGAVHGYVEGYGADAARATVRFDILPESRSEPLIRQEVEARPAGPVRALFSRVMPADTLPAGRYRLQATLALDGRVSVMSRPFEIPERSREADSKTASRELFLPVQSSELALPFDPADALRPETLDALRTEVPLPADASFGAGIEQLRRGDYEAAERSFKAAIQPDTDFTAAVAYRGVCFAMAGDDADAAGAWQTALIKGRNVPPAVYLWLGNALLRTHDLGRARAVLEQAASRWPADTRFARPLAMVYAVTGRGPDAVLMLQKYLETTTADPDALYRGVQWLYELRAAGVMRDRDADLAMARRYAAVSRLGGANQTLVRQWLDYLMKS